MYGNQASVSEFYYFTLLNNFKTFLKDIGEFFLHILNKLTCSLREFIIKVTNSVFSCFKKKRTYLMVISYTKL